MKYPGRKSIVATSIVAAVLILGGAGLILHGHQHKKSTHPVSQTVGDHTISLNGPPTSSGSGGLSVSGQADSLGQLNGNKPSGGSTGSSGTSSNSDVDPSSFAQYDKYQSGQNALLGELQPGTGAELAVGQKAGIYYKVWLTNGTPVDQSPVSSSGQPQPFSYILGAHQVILGLEQGTVGMKVGGKRLIIVPPSVGYGAQGQGTIPPNAVLVFEVQLVSTQ